jgi:hypothetical protein
VGSVEIPGDAPRAGRKSLSSAQIRDPLGTLAAAYGVERDLSHIALAITERLPVELDDLHLEAISFEARFTVVFGIVASLVLDGRPGVARGPSSSGRQWWGRCPSTSAPSPLTASWTWSALGSGRPWAEKRPVVHAAPPVEGWMANPEGADVALDSMSDGAKP